MTYVGICSFKSSYIFFFASHVASATTMSMRSKWGNASPWLHFVLTTEPKDDFTSGQMSLGRYSYASETVAFLPPHKMTRSAPAA